MNILDVPSLIVFVLQTLKVKSAGKFQTHFVITNQWLK